MVSNSRTAGAGMQHSDWGGLRDAPFSPSGIVSGRWKTHRLSCESTATPPTCPVTHLFGSACDHSGSGSNSGTCCRAACAAAVRSSTATATPIVTMRAKAPPTAHKRQAGRRPVDICESHCGRHRSCADSGRGLQAGGADVGARRGRAQRGRRVRPQAGRAGAGVLAVHAVARAQPRADPVAVAVCLDQPSGSEKVERPGGSA